MQEEVNRTQQGWSIDKNFVRIGAEIAASDNDLLRPERMQYTHRLYAVRLWLHVDPW